MQFENGQTLGDYHDNIERAAERLLQNNKERKLIVVFTGAGISAESGISTFRDAGGLWEGYEISKVASPEGWRKNPKQVLEFYNLRRSKLGAAEPNAGHKAIVELEKYFRVAVITQNVDNLHEKAGSSFILHLHGELTKVKGEAYPHYVYDLGIQPISLGDVCQMGSQLRPHVVWFGESVPLITLGAEITAQADAFLVIGTSMVVYPAAGLIDEVRAEAPKYVIDKNIPSLPSRYPNLKKVEKPGTQGVPEVVNELIATLA
jgi:NAD-dependent deacetylase